MRSNGLMWYGCPAPLSPTLKDAAHADGGIPECCCSYRLRGNPPAHETFGGKVKYLIRGRSSCSPSTPCSTPPSAPAPLEALELRGYRYAAVNKSVKKIKLAALKVTYNDGLFLAISFLVVAVAVLISTLL